MNAGNEHPIPFIQDYIQSWIRCLEELSPQGIEEVADTIYNAWTKGKRVFIMGNGGSATTAAHFARDLQIGAAAEGKPRIRAISLADNIAVVTSLANDVGYSYIFEEQLAGQLEEGDVVIGLSASGNSPNIIRAMEFARKNGAVTVGLIGFGGGKLKGMVHKYIVLSSKDYRQIEDIHLGLAHIISCLVQEKIARV